MRSQPRGWLVLICVLVLAASLAACTSTSTSKKVPLPTSTPGSIQIAVDRSLYSTSQPIGVTVTNTTKNPYYAMSGRSACTFLQLQEYNQKQGKWISVDGCNSVNPPAVRVIPASVVVPFTLAPGIIPASDPNVWEVGTYRVALQYSLQNDGVSELQIAYSPGFQIKD